MEVKPNTLLACSCCGTYFRTWKGYQDQDCDKGYGLCPRCYTENEKLTEAEIDRCIGLLIDALSERNREKFKALNRDQQTLLALKAIDDGIITYQIGQTH